MERNHKKVIVQMRGPSRERRPVVTQRDLAEENFLHNEARRAVKAWRGKREAIRWALRSGARIEPGLRSAEIKMREALIFQ